MYSPVSRLQASPEFKGIKTDAGPHLAEPLGRFKPALNSKGLRQVNAGGDGLFAALQASPEFKGIKTSSQDRPHFPFGFKPALNSKGLRR